MAGKHGPTARVCGHILTTVLIEAAELAAPRTGVRARLLEDLDCCGYLCAMTGRLV